MKQESPGSAGKASQGRDPTSGESLKSYFDTIPHDRLMALVEGSIGDSRVLALIDSFLQQEIISDVARWQPTTGIPLEADLSPLLANLYPHPLDVLMEQSGNRMVRYADDFLILCATEAETAEALRPVSASVDANGLTLYTDKTRIGDSPQNGEGFDFLGYRFEADGRFVRNRTPQAFEDKERARTIGSGGDSLTRIIADLTPMLRGWYGYFLHARPRLFRRLDQFIRRRLRAVLRKQDERPSMERSEADHRQWTNAFFAEPGLFTQPAAHEDARCSW